MQCAPQNRNARLGLAALYRYGGLMTEARRQLEYLVAHGLSCHIVLNNLATLLQDLGEPERALPLLDEAIKHHPEMAETRSNYLIGLQYLPHVTPQQLHASAKAWGDWAMTLQGATCERPDMNTANRDLNSRPLRIGYVSGDLREHPVGWFIKPVLEAHDARRVRPYVYDNGDRPDGLTAALQTTLEQFHPGASGWRPIGALTDEAVAHCIRADEIDILVDLSGHTAKSRLTLFARRPAPLQVSWLGYFATTGLPTLDYVFLDPWHAPAGTEAQFTERIVRLPHNRFCYRPPPFAPEVAPPPCRQTGVITFGSFNNTAKLNAEVLQVWSQIMTAVPQSRLVLKWRTLADEDYCTLLHEKFAAQGISKTRILLRRVSEHRQLLAEYADIDIALDPFPFSGGQTSCDALWMGVPVITWPQARVVSRQTWSFLGNIGLTELAAASAADYVRIAVTLAHDRDRLQQLRETLRGRLNNSPLCDVAGFTRSFEDALWDIYRQIAAESSYQQAIQALSASDSAKAEAGLRAAIQQQPNVAHYHAHLGIVLKLTGHLTERIACYRRAIELDPQEPSYPANLSVALCEAGHLTAAEAAAVQAIHLDPQRAESHYNLGVVKKSHPDWPAAADNFRRAAELKQAAVTDAPHPEHAAITYWQTAAHAWLMAGAPVQAVSAFQAALRAHGPQASRVRAGLLIDLAEAFDILCHRDLAEIALREALSIEPQSVPAWNLLGNVQRAQGNYDGAQQAFEKLLALNPDNTAARGNLGTVCHQRGDNAAAIRYIQQTLAADPSLGVMWTNLGNILTYAMDHGPQEVRATFADWDRQIARPLRDPRPHPNTPDPARRLKIGYVSPDFRKHAVAYFALPLLTHHDKTQVEVFCYYNHRQQDEWTEQFKTVADHWRDVVSLDDKALAEQIRQDGIDLLIDLSGHTEGNRLLVFARKPAPVSDFETKTIRGEACFRAALQMKAQGFTPDVIIAHHGWGESLFLKDVWPQAKLGIYCEFFYHPHGADVGFDPEFPPKDEGEVCRLRLKNLNNLLHFEIADAGISPTHWQASTFPDPFRSQITVVHDGIDTEAVAPNPNVSLTLNGNLVLTKQDEVITFVNRNLEPYRGYHVFMRALPEILKRRPKTRILIVGGDDVSYGARPENGQKWKDIFAAEVRPQIGDADWARVHFLGNIPYQHFIPLLQLSTVHVYLTYPFVLSWSLLEAMSAGCTIVASDTQPLHEAIRHDETGRLVNFFDVPALANEVCALLDDPAARQRLGANARAFAQANYELKTVCLPRQLAWVEGLVR